MNEDYAINVETIESKLDELLILLIAKITNEDAESDKDGKISKYVDEFKELYKLRQADISRDFDQGIKDAERERKNCEYLEDVARKTEEIKLRNRELDLREREIVVKEREVDIREASQKDSGRWWNNPLIPTVMSCATAVGINAYAIKINNSEFPIKNNISQWMQKANIKLPFGF